MASMGYTDKQTNVSNYRIPIHAVRAVQAVKMGNNTIREGSGAHMSIKHDTGIMQIYTNCCNGPVARNSGM